MPGARALLGLISLLFLLYLLISTRRRSQQSLLLEDSVVRQAIEKAEADNKTIHSVRETSQELIAEVARHSETMQNIIARGPPELLMKTQPSYQKMDTMIAIAKQELLLLKEEHELMELSLARAQKAFGHLLERGANVTELFTTSAGKEEL